MSVTKNWHISVFLISVIPILHSDFFIASQALKCHPCCGHPCTRHFLSKLLHSAAFLDVRVCPEALGAPLLKNQTILASHCFVLVLLFFKDSFIRTFGLTLAQISLPRCIEIFIHLQISIVRRNSAHVIVSLLHCCLRDHGRDGMV